MNLRPHVALLAAAATIGACTIAPIPGGVGPGGGVGDAPPPGFGTLRQEEVSLVMTSGDLQIMITPLHESVTHVTAPDTERRLAGLVDIHARGPRSDGTGLFLVSFFSDQPDVPFIPEEIQFISRGLRVRPQSIEPVTPSWGARRLEQQRTEMAVYSFGDGVDLESTLILAYQFDQSNQWNVILPRIQAERARARARAGIESRD